MYIDVSASQILLLVFVLARQEVCRAGEMNFFFVWLVLRDDHLKTANTNWPQASVFY